MLTRLLLLLLLPLMGLGQNPPKTDVDLRLGLTTFRDNRYSVFRYAMPTVGFQLNRTKSVGTGEKWLTVGAYWGQDVQTGRFFSRTAGLSSSLQRTYRLGSANTSKPSQFGLGWQAQLAIQTYYDRLAFNETTDSHIGGYAALELAPMLYYRWEFKLANRPALFTNSLSVPLLTGLVAGNNAGNYSAGVAFPGAFTGLSNQLWLTLNTPARHPWRIGYQWSYRAIQLADANQQHAFNGLVFAWTL
ncbi:hypothetical protein [Fibrella aquatilis]|uniref:DUF2490 domain-containing protein n=1 Tax=Fibrella aquatilis TaxID=2817059 RepID=A0A939G2U1_9BACT|nr:hypothetical protein [Fibrella aquatilis]MBO0931039.1 hypothetical protein [Fibrella aquatilis]